MSPHLILYGIVLPYSLGQVASGLMHIAITSILAQWCRNRGLFGSSQPANCTHSPLPFSLTYTLTCSLLQEVINSWPHIFSVPPWWQHKPTGVVARSRRSTNAKWKETAWKRAWPHPKNSCFMPSQFGIHFYKEKERELKWEALV